MLAYRDCDACVAYAHSQFADLQAAGVDTRVIMIARDDLNGVPQSTAAERNTVAELWVNRSWALYRKWMDAPAASWTAPGVPAADGDVARSAVVEVGRDMVERLRPLLAENGIDLVYPVVIWQTKDGVLEGCACADPKAYGAVRKALGVQ